MARFDLYRSADADACFLDVQVDMTLVSSCRRVVVSSCRRVVVPLLPPIIAPKPGCRLKPTFVIGGKDYVMVTQFISAARSSELPSASDVSRHHDKITDALDMLFQGF